MHIDSFFTYSHSEIALKACRNIQRLKFDCRPLCLGFNQWSCVRSPWCRCTELRPLSRHGSYHLVFHDLQGVSYWYVCLKLTMRDFVLRSFIIVTMGNIWCYKQDFRKNWNAPSIWLYLSHPQSSQSLSDFCLIFLLILRYMNCWESQLAGLIRLIICLVFYLRRKNLLNSLVLHGVYKHMEHGVDSAVHAAKWGSGV